MLVLVLFAVEFDGTFIVRVEAYFPSCFVAGLATAVRVGATRGRGFREEEDEELVGDCEV